MSRVHAGDYIGVYSPAGSDAINAMQALDTAMDKMIEDDHGWCVACRTLFCPDDVGQVYMLAKSCVPNVPQFICRDCLLTNSTKVEHVLNQLDVLTEKGGE